MDKWMDQCLGKEELSDEEMEKKVAECLGEEKTERVDGDNIFQFILKVPLFVALLLYNSCFFADKDDEAQNRVVIAPWIIAGISYTSYCTKNGCSTALCPKAVCWLGRNDSKYFVHLKYVYMLLLRNKRFMFDEMFL